VIYNKNSIHGCLGELAVSTEPWQTADNYIYNIRKKKHPRTKILGSALFKVDVVVGFITALTNAGSSINEVAEINNTLNSSLDNESVYRQCR
jgi:hypothetical protein